MVRSTRLLAALLAFSFVPLTGPSAPAQGKKGGEFIPGTVVSIEKEKTGRNYKMKVKSTADDSEFDVPLKPATQLFVNFKGDDSFLRPGVVILTSALSNGTNYSANDFTVYPGTHFPQPHLTPDPKDNSKMVFEMCGKVLSKEADGLIVQCGPQPKKVLFESAIAVTVKVSDASLIKEGDTVEVDGTMIKAKKTLNATTVNVTSAEPVNADEFFAALEEKSGKKKTAKTKVTKKTEAGESAAGGGGGGGEADPFGVLKTKKGPKTKAEKAAEAEAKKEELKKEKEEKADAKKDAEKGTDTEKKEAEKIEKKADN